MVGGVGVINMINVIFVVEILMVVMMRRSLKRNDQCEVLVDFDICLFDGIDWSFGMFLVWVMVIRSGCFFFLIVFMFGDVEC